jgi:hypothetical protein
MAGVMDISTPAAIQFIFFILLWPVFRRLGTPGDAFAIIAEKPFDGNKNLRGFGVCAENIFLVKLAA